VSDRTGLLEDLDLLGMGPYEVEDLVVGMDRMFEERSESGDGLAAPGRSVDQEGPAALDDGRDLAQNRFLARPRAIGEQERYLGRGRGGGRERPSCTGERTMGVLSCALTGTEMGGASPSDGGERARTAGRKYPARAPLTRRSNGPRTALAASST